MSKTDEITVSYEKLDNENARAPFGSATPYPHIIIDELFDDQDLHMIRQEFPSDADPVWQFINHSHSRKQALADTSLMGPVSRAYFAAVASAAFVQALERITGISGLEPDPYLFGGGYHLSLPGGFLDIHADFPTHPDLPLIRRLNLITYIGPDWEEGDGGVFEMWTRDSTEALRRVEPKFNRSVIFKTGTDTYHGHPEPLRHHPRPSLAVFYYTQDLSNNPHPAQPPTDYLAERRRA
jgi:Rps23 Pro-64 3,4-dihydroxylase Tpa1-like proline 4-hydroxylase